MKVTCPKCGKKTPEGAFCENCGGEIRSQESGVRNQELGVEGQESGVGKQELGVGSQESEVRSQGVVAARDCPLQEPVIQEEGRAGSRPATDDSGESANNESHSSDHGNSSHETGKGEGLPQLAGPSRGMPVLEVDRMCVQFEGLMGTVRFRLTPPAGGLEKVWVFLEHAVSGQRWWWGPRNVRGTRELKVPLGGQVAGWPTWTVRLECMGKDGKRSWEGDVDLLVVRPREALRSADNLKVEITNHITLGNASDANVNQRALDGLEKVAAAENPFDEWRKVALGPGRSWARVDLYEAEGGAEPALPPAGAATDRLVLRRGEWMVRVFSGTELQFGRNRPEPGENDFTLRPGPGGARLAYEYISRTHCTFSRSGGAAELRDGVKSPVEGWKSSKYGTWWKGRRLEGDKPARLGIGTTGLVSFGGAPGAGAVTLRADAGEGWLLLRRTDGVKEAILWLWGDCDLGRVDVSATGTTVSRKDVGFVWRRSGLSGWLVPGESAQIGDGTQILVEKAAGRI